MEFFSEDVEESISVHSEFEYQEIEKEANTFAAEILMPEQFLLELSVNSENLSSLHSSISRKTGVSEQAAAIRMGQVLPTNILFCAESDGEILYSGKTPGTLASIPYSGEITPDQMFSDAEEYSSHTVKSITIHWWKLRSKKVFMKSDDLREWREILDGMVEEMFPFENAKKIKSTINARIAAVNGRLKQVNRQDKDSLLAEFHNRLLSFPDLKEFVKHRDFLVFLTKKVESLADKK